MGVLETFRERYSSLKYSEVKARIQTEESFRQEIESIYVATTHRKLNKGCNDCWLDAFILLTRTDINKLESMGTRQFELKTGALLIDVECGDNAKLASHHNLTDELALYHLATNPKCIKKFAKYPENYEQLVAEYIAGQDKKPTDGEENEVREALEKAVSKAKSALTTAKKNLSKVQKGTDANKIAKAEERVATAEEALAAAEKALEDFEVEQGFAEGDSGKSDDIKPTDGEGSRE